MVRELLHRVTVYDLESSRVDDGDGVIHDVRHVDPLGQTGQRLLDLGGHRRGVDVLGSLLFRRLLLSRGVFRPFLLGLLLAGGLLLLELWLLVDGLLLLLSLPGEVGDLDEQPVPVRRVP